MVLKRPAFSNLGQEDFGVESLLFFRFHWWPLSRIHGPLLGGHTFYDDYATARVKRLPPHSLFVLVSTFEQIL